MMTKALLLMSVCMLCTISMAWGCVTGAGPSWEIGQPGGRPRPSSGRGQVGPGESGPWVPRIPTNVVRYLAGNISKEIAFASIDLDDNGLVSFDEWTLGGGAMAEFNHMLIRLDTDGDNNISLAELKPFSLPTRSNGDTAPRLLDFKGAPEEATLEQITPRPQRRRNGRRRNRPRGRGAGRGQQRIP